MTIDTTGLSTDEKVDLLLEKVLVIESKVNDLIPEIKPVIDQLTESPMFRMLTGGKKRNA